jgi:hypothetical protein
MKIRKDRGFQIQNYEHRKALVWALIESGYGVQVEVKPKGLMEQEYWVRIIGLEEDDETARCATVSGL